MRKVYKWYNGICMVSVYNNAAITSYVLKGHSKTAHKNPYISNTEPPIGDSTWYEAPEQTFQDNHCSVADCMFTLTVIHCAWGHHAPA